MVSNFKNNRFNLSFMNIIHGNFVRFFNCYQCLSTQYIEIGLRLNVSLSALDVKVYDVVKKFNIVHGCGERFIVYTAV